MQLQHFQQLQHLQQFQQFQLQSDQAAQAQAFALAQHEQAMALMASQHKIQQMFGNWQTPPQQLPLAPAVNAFKNSSPSHVLANFQLPLPPALPEALKRVSSSSPLMMSESSDESTPLNHSRNLDDAQPPILSLVASAALAATPLAASPRCSSASSGSSNSNSAVIRRRRRPVFCPLPLSKSPNDQAHFGSFVRKFFSFYQERLSGRPASPSGEKSTLLHLKLIERLEAAIAAEKNNSPAHILSAAHIQSIICNAYLKETQMAAALPTENKAGAESSHTLIHCLTGPLEELRRKGKYYASLDSEQLTIELQACFKFKFLQKCAKQEGIELKPQGIQEKSLIGEEKK